ncbi:MAG: hypothetical protein J0M15_04495 [Deltaproteobacteria bacterium]|nr:hypothetical protein [Deltaproteobacteria bacterium]
MKITTLLTAEYCAEYGDSHCTIRLSLSRNQSYLTAIKVVGFSVEYYVNYQPSEQ